MVSDLSENRESPHFSSGCSRVRTNRLSSMLMFEVPKPRCNLRIIAEHKCQLYMKIVDFGFVSSMYFSSRLSVPSFGTIKTRSRKTDIT